MISTKLISIVTLSSLLLSACGGGGGSKTPDTNSGGTSGSGGGNNGNTITNTCSDTISGNGKTAIYKSGSEGDIEFDCKLPSKTNPNGQEYSLKNGMASLNIKSVQRTTDINYSCDNGIAFKGSSSANYKTGKINYTGSYNGSSISCTETYNPAALPTTISDHDSIERLLENEFEDNDPIQSSCPDDLDNTDSENIICSGSFDRQYNITDDNNKVHKLSVDISSK